MGRLEKNVDKINGALRYQVDGMETMAPAGLICVCLNRWRRFRDVLNAGFAGCSHSDARKTSTGVVGDSSWRSRCGRRSPCGLGSHRQDSGSPQG